MAVPKKKTSKAKSRSHQAAAWVLSRPARSVCPQCQARRRRTWSARPAGGTRAAPGRRDRLLSPPRRPGPRRCRRSRSPWTPWAATTPPARSSPAPAAPSTSSASRSCWSGRPTRSATPVGLEVIPAREVIAMDDDPAPAVRAKKDSSLVRAAEAVRDGKALRHGERRATPARRWPRRCCAWAGCSGVVRPAHRHADPAARVAPTVLLDAGANAECTPGHAGAVRPDGRGVRSAALSGSPSPASALLSIGEETSKGTPLVKETHELLDQAGPDSDSSATSRAATSCPPPADVVVTDGFTGNVALKTLEGSLRFFLDTLLEVIGADDDDQGGRRGHAAAPACRSPAEFDPESTGGAMLLGVDGVCVISHGSSTATAIVSAPSAWPTTWPSAGWSDRLARRRRARPERGNTALNRDLPSCGLDQAVCRRNSTQETRARRNPRGERSPRTPRGVRAGPGPAGRHLGDRARPISESSSFAEDLDADSLALIELVEALEEELGERTVGLPHRGRGPRGPPHGS